ncbi:MAG: hypothetical protein IJD45_01120 [Clostridia bacterium]|nr:hypothetical protein [Clostridia bacterium]
MIKYIFPLILIILNIGAAVVCAVTHDFKMAIYWLAAAVLNICVTEGCVASVPRRKHKKHRIQKKWLKRFGKTFEPYRGLVVAKICNETVLYCHPKHWDKFIKMSKKKGIEVQCPIKN